VTPAQRVLRLAASCASGAGALLWTRTDGGRRCGVCRSVVPDEGVAEHEQIHAREYALVVMLADDLQGRALAHSVADRYSELLRLSTADEQRRQALRERAEALAICQSTERYRKQLIMLHGEIEMEQRERGAVLLSRSPSGPHRDASPHRDRFELIDYD